MIFHFNGGWAKPYGAAGRGVVITCTRYGLLGSFIGLVMEVNELTLNGISLYNQLYHLYSKVAISFIRLNQLCRLCWIFSTKSHNKLHFAASRPTTVVVVIHSDLHFYSFSVEVYFFLRQCPKLLFISQIRSFYNRVAHMIFHMCCVVFKYGESIIYESCRTWRKMR